MQSAVDQEYRLEKPERVTNNYLSVLRYYMNRLAIFSNRSKFWSQFRRKLAWQEGRMLVNHKHRFIYCSIPKVACTSLKTVLVKTSNSPKKNELLQIQSRNKFHARVDDEFGLSKVELNKAIKLLHHSDYFKFVFVRDPWDRLVSAYLNKFVEVQEPEAKHLIQCFYQSKKQTVDYSRSITFTQFVRLICSLKDKQLDHHWMPQFFFCHLSTLTLPDALSD